MSEEDILRELIRRNLAASSAPKVDVLSRLFDKQQAFATDSAKLKAATCTRRAGKSEGEGTILVNAAIQHPGSTVPYIALTRDSARRIMWPVLESINEEFKLGAELTESNLVMSIPNGSRVQLFGADMKNFIRRLRGGKYPRVGIDEAQAFGAHLSELIDDVLIPATADYDGFIDLLGTPGPVPRGYFFEASKGMHGFKPFSWSLLDNPHMPNARGFVDSLMKRKGWTIENPTYRREYLGEWVEDLDALVYKFMRGRNEYRGLPKDSDWNNILSVDYGYNDATAFGITSYNFKRPKVFLQHAEGHREWIPSQIGARMQQLIERYQPVKIVADTGGLGKSITEEMVRRFGIPVVAAQKTDKQTWIHLMNGDMIDGNYLIHESLDEVKSQMLTLTKAEDGTEEPGLPNDLCDVALYGYREAKAYAFEPDVKKPKTVTEKYEAEERALWDDEEESMIKASRSDWWER